MKFLILTPEIPYPAFHGQRADVWRRILSLRTLGVDVAIVYFYDADNSSDHAKFKKLCEIKSITAMGFKIKRSPFVDLINIVRSLWFRNPYHTITRIPDKKDLDSIERLIREYSPQVVWIEGLWMMEFFRTLVRDKTLKNSYIYRSHNIEFQYMYSQLSNSASKLKRWFQTYSIEAYEFKALKNARLIFDCSFDDVNYWREKEINNIEVLTPLPESALLNHQELLNMRAQSKAFDILFLGNLKTPNNVKGVFFLINEVLPYIKKRIPQVKVLIAGSSPQESIINLCALNPSVELRANVSDPFDLMCQSRVLVNPVATGSGVMVKMLDLIMTDQPIVSTTQGVYGLPQSVKEAVDIADDAIDFANCILDYLESRKNVNLSQREVIRDLFTTKRIEEVVEKIKSNLP